MERKLAAILSAAVKGYSRLMGEDEEATIRTLTTYREVLTTLIEQHHGREEAIAAQKKALTLNPDLWPSHMALAVIPDR